MDSQERELWKAEYDWLSVRLIAWKIFYYRPEMVHPDWQRQLEIPDHEYDSWERVYLHHCKALGLPNTVVHKGYPDYLDIDYSKAMVEVDLDRPDVQKILDRIGKKK